MKPKSIYSKSGKGVQEASGKTSLLKRGDRAVLSAIDGRATLGEVAQKVGKSFDPAFQQLITQLDKDGFVREVTAGGSAGAAPKPAVPGKPATKAPPPPQPPSGGNTDLDFTTIMPAIRRGAQPPPAPAPKPAPSDEISRRAKEQESALYKAREEAEARAQAERDRLRGETEAKARAETEAKIRAETEKKVREESEARLKAEAEAKAKAARDAALLEAERKAKEEAERARREAEELRQRLEEERRRKEEEERRAREEAERKRREEEEFRRIGEEMRRAREEAERRAREQEEAKRREEREALEETKTRQPTLQAAPPPPPTPSANAGGASSLDALMADLDSFSQREEEERNAREAAERKTREEKKRRAQEESERQARERAEKERRDAVERRRIEEEARRVREEEERRQREEEERRRLEAEERRRSAREAQAAAKQDQAAAKGASAAPADDIGVSDDDLHMDDVRKDEAAVSKEARRALREKEREQRQREKEVRERAAMAARAPEPVKYSRPRRRRKWGRPVAIMLFLLLVAGVVSLHVMPLPIKDYEDAASEALGRPVRVASARLWLFTGVMLNLEGVSIGDTVKIASVRAYPRIGSLIDEKKAFRRIEIEGMTIPQQALAETLSAKIQSDHFSVGRLIVTKLKLEGPVPLPVLEADAVIGTDGAFRSVTLSGPESLNVKLTPGGKGDVEFDITASSVTLPIAPELSLSSFAMNGTATRQGMNITGWGGSVLEGALSGTANLRWGSTWVVDGTIAVRGINAAVFAPALLSEGKADATGRFSMSGADPARLSGATRLEGNFSMNKGVLGSVDLGRAIKTNGREFAGRTLFVELSGQGVYERGAVALRNVRVGAGALVAGITLDIAPSGALSGRIAAELKTAQQGGLRTTLNLGGTMREPQVRN